VTSPVGGGSRAFRVTSGTGPGDGGDWSAANPGVASLGADGPVCGVALRAHPPAKLNLSLAVTGRRPDGFHELISVAVPIDLADALAFEPGGEADRLDCDDPSVPADARNLVLRAAEALRRRMPGAPFGRWVLAKRIPHGAGLGGGSSDAAAALRILNLACPVPMGEAELASVAAGVGSDCPLFLHPRGALLRGRGERLEALPAPVQAALTGRRVILAKPSWGIPTSEAYRWRAELGNYQDAGEAESRLREALAATDPLEALVALGNGLEPAVESRHPGLFRGLAAVRDRLGLTGRMTGSGSCCFLVSDGREDLSAVRSLLEPAWGEGVWLARSTLL